MFQRDYPFMGAGNVEIYGIFSILCPKTEKSTSYIILKKCKPRHFGTGNTSFSCASIQPTYIYNSHPLDDIHICTYIGVTTVRTLNFKIFRKSGLFLFWLLALTDLFKIICGQKERASVLYGSKKVIPVMNITRICSCRSKNRQSDNLVALLWHPLQMRQT